MLKLVLPDLYVIKSMYNNDIQKGISSLYIIGAVLCMIYLMSKLYGKEFPIIQAEIVVKPRLCEVKIFSCVHNYKHILCSTINIKRCINIVLLTCTTQHLTL